MSSLNNTSFIGNLAADPVVKQVGDQMVVNFRVAVNKVYKGQEKTTWINCSAWNESAEYALEHLKKGSQVYLSGELEVSTWERTVVAPISKEEFVIKMDMYSINCHEIIATVNMKSDIMAPITMEEIPIELAADTN